MTNPQKAQMFPFVARVFRPQSTSRPAATAHAHSTQGVRDTRKEVVLMALRDTLRRHSIPQDLVGVELFPGSTISNRRGLHLRFVLRDQHAKVLPHAVAFQGAVQARIRRLDPLAVEWLSGISWKLDAGEGACPGLPPASYWDAPPASAASCGGDTARDRLSRMFDAADAKERRAAPGDFHPTLPIALG